MCIRDRLGQIEQRLAAQQTLANRAGLTRSASLEARLAQLEEMLTTMALRFDTTAAAPAAPLAGLGADAPADLRWQLGQMEEMLRAARGQADMLERRMTTLTTRIDRAHADNEFRFGQIEEGLRGSGIEISAGLPEGAPKVIGHIATPIETPIDVEVQSPVAALDTPDTLVAPDAPLIGEGAMPDDAATPARPTPAAGPDALYARALAALRGGDYLMAEADFGKLLAGFPGHRLAGNAQYWLGETYYVRRDYKQAAQAFLNGYTKYARSPKAPDSLLKLGMTLAALGETGSGCDAFAELDVKFPDAPQAIVKRVEIEKRRAGCDA